MRNCDALLCRLSNNMADFWEGAEICFKGWAINWDEQLFWTTSGTTNSMGECGSDTHICFNFCKQHPRAARKDSDWSHLTPTDAVKNWMRKSTFFEEVALRSEIPKDFFGGRKQRKNPFRAATNTNSTTSCCAHTLLFVFRLGVELRSIDTTHPSWNKSMRSTALFGLCTEG